MEVTGWDLETLHKVWTVKPGPFLQCLARTPDGARLLTLGPRERALFDLATGTEIAPVQPARFDPRTGERLAGDKIAFREANCAAFAPDGKSVVIGQGFPEAEVCSLFAPPPSDNGGPAIRRPA